MLTETKTEGSLSGSCSILISKSMAKENEINFGVCSSAGWEDKGLRKTNQDDWAVAWDGEEDDDIDGDNSGNKKEKKKIKGGDDNNNKEEEELKMFYAFVFDGHGEDGAAVSSFLRRILPAVVQTKVQNMMKDYKVDEISQDLLEDVLIDTFIITNNALCELPPGLVETTYSGSAATGVIIFEYKSKIYLVSSNTGDSRAVWAKRVHDNKSGNSSRPFEIISQSNDHKPDRQDEEKRIKEMGGTVTRGRGVARVGGYALSRAFGDKIAHEDGLIVEPEIIVSELQSESEVVVILGSDGIWDFVSSEEAVDVFGKSIGKNEGTLSETCDKASTEIVNLAKSRWDAEYKSYVDDCTSLCIHIQIPSKQKQIKSKL